MTLGAWGGGSWRARWCPTAVSRNIDPCGILSSMKPYSIDLRQRIVAATERGMSRTKIAATFGVSLSTIKRLVARRRRNTTDDLAAKVPPGRRRTIPPEQQAALWAQLEANRDGTIQTHARLWNEAHGTTVSQSTVARAIRRLGWTYKKRRWEPPSATSRPALRIENGERGVLRTRS
jgi:transposase